MCHTIMFMSFSRIILQLPDRLDVQNFKTIEQLTCMIKTNEISPDLIPGWVPENDHIFDQPPETALLTVLELNRMDK